MLPRLPPLDARIPTWNQADLVERDCPICNDTGSPQCVRPDGLTVRRCARCTALFVSPAPSDTQLNAFYATYDAAHRRFAQFSADELRRSYDRVDPASDFRIHELMTLLPLQGRRVLDIGFGRAEFLFQLKRLGAVTHGVELDDDAIELARELGLERVRKGTVVDCANDSPYDLIILNDIIEHPLDPRALLQQAARKLVPGGFLLVWTPNGAQAFRDQERTCLRVDLEHMQYLTPATCTKLAGDLDLRIAHLETCGFPDLNELERRPGSPIPLRRRFTRLVRRVPGFLALNAYRRRLMTLDERRGAYHLFCIFESKPAISEDVHM